MRLILHILGVDNPSGVAYLWWSGIGADLPMFIGTGIYLRRHNCHRPGCWRFGRHRIDGTPYVVCRRHHPTA